MRAPRWACWDTKDVSHDYIDTRICFPANWDHIPFGWPGTQAPVDFVTPEGIVPSLDLMYEIGAPSPSGARTLALPAPVAGMVAPVGGAEDFVSSDDEIPEVRPARAQTQGSASERRPGSVDGAATSPGEPPGASADMPLPRLGWGRYAPGGMAPPARGRASRPPPPPLPGTERQPHRQHRTPRNASLSSSATSRSGSPASTRGGTAETRRAGRSPERPPSQLGAAQSRGGTPRPSPSQATVHARNYQEVSGQAWQDPSLRAIGMKPMDPVANVRTL